MGNMAPKISDAHFFEALEADNKNFRADQRRMQFQLTVCTRLEALEKKEQPHLQPTSSYRPAQPESQHEVPPL
ncbi:unnamed protein product [Spirodela intermedia]|uniref:Uncharacterized protein n=1 Tax=Spirodela intermedia TaxID=51605 RepID=A0A7I8LGJ3_SPIIN|nr:unnamed protein product [Spirodela intermedia]